MRVLLEVVGAFFLVVLVATVFFVAGVGIVLPVLLLGLVWWVARGLHLPPRTR